MPELKEATRVIAAAANYSRAAETRNQALRDAYANGVQVHELVKLLEDGGAPLGRQHVHRIVAGARPWKPAVDIAEATACYQQGASLRMLAKHFGCHENVVKKALIEAGVQIRDREAAKRAARLARKETA